MSIVADLIYIIKAQQEWIDAVPEEALTQTMPGIDGDWVDETVDAAEKYETVEAGRNTFLYERNIALQEQNEEVMSSLASIEERLKMLKNQYSLSPWIYNFCEDAMIHCNPTESLKLRDQEQQKVGAASFKYELSASVNIAVRPHIEGVFQVWLGKQEKTDERN